jgi:hypothetical protein
MINRCANPNSPDYKRYGGKGIEVCERWRDFRNFLEDMGSRPIGTSLDRKDGNQNYEPGNCRWATPLEQFRQNRKLTDDQIAAIRDDDRTYVEIARDYEIASAYVSQIFTGKTRRQEGAIYPTKRRPMPRGEQASRAKLTDNQVRQVRLLYASGFCTQRDIASMFKMSASQINNIVHGRQRKAVEREEVAAA